LVVQITYHCNNEILEWQWASDDKLMPYPYFTSCYLVDGLLIDSSAPGGENDFREFVKSLNREEMIDKCFITHSHEDHAGNAHLLSTEFGIPIYSSKKAANLLKKGKTYPDYRQLAWGPKLLPVNSNVIDEPIITKSEKYKFELFPMVGHAPDLVALIEKDQQWAFVADAVQPKYKMIFGRNSDIQEDISLIYQSLLKLYEFTENMDNLLIFSAGNEVLQGREIIKEKLEEIENLHAKVHEEYIKLQKDGFKGEKLFKKIVKNIFKRENIISRLTQGDLSRENLIISLLKWEKKRD
jgi:glyoxylase-like metal-dependent hydrolase (beta-lactamase superfamily II)